MSGAGQKFVHKVDAELAGDAQYKSFDDIPSYALNFGSTVQFMPGVYEMGSVALDSLTLEGLGNRDDVVLANLVLTNSSANTINFRNLTLAGPNSIAASGSSSIKINAGTNATIKFREVVFTTGDFGIDNQATLGLVYLDRCDASAVDRAIRSNAAVDVKYSQLNSSANAYFTNANAIGRAVTVLGSTSGGSNTGSSTETVTAFIS